MTDFEIVKQAAPLKVFAEDRLQKRRGRYVCPFCNSGGHERANSDSAFSIKDEKFRCFSCGTSGDVFDLAAQVDGIDPSDKTAQLHAVARWANVTLQDKSREHSSTNTQTVRNAPLEENSLIVDYSEGVAAERSYIENARTHLSQAETYITGRGFSMAEAEALGFGYDPEKKRLVIPWQGSAHYHIDRDITGTATAKYVKPPSDKVGTQPLWNPAALKAEGLFVCEGAIDAYALKVCGFEAVAAGGTGTREIVAILIARSYSGIVIDLMDDDKAGNRASQELQESLAAAGISYSKASLSETGAKDAGEVFERDRKALKAFLSRNYEKALSELHEKREAAYRATLSRCRVVDATDIASEIFTLAQEPQVIPTGFRKLDDVLNGGLQCGFLYVLGAVSSIGKTTLATQICDQIAATGRGALFVTIEQGAREIVAKSLSRLMALGGNPASTTELTRSKSRSFWSAEKTAAFFDVCNRYSTTIAPNMHILEGVRQPSVSDIKTLAETIGEHDGKPPFVCLDYLQLLAAQSDRDSDKQATDKNVMSLRQLARDLETPVFAISSLNRASYSGGVALDSFKESGAVEYGSDVLLGLQPKGISEAIADLVDSKAKRAADKHTRDHKDSLERNCELIILKQRAGRTPKEGIPIKFLTTSSLFVEC